MSVLNGLACDELNLGDRRKSKKTSWCVCALCTSVTQFVLKRDDHGMFRFAPLQGEVAKVILTRHQKRVEDLDTFYLVLESNSNNERLMERSTAALHVARLLRWPWPILFSLVIVPRFIRDGVYDLIARYRYRMFGKHDLCILPESEWHERFLD